MLNLSFLPSAQSADPARERAGWFIFLGVFVGTPIMGTVWFFLLCGITRLLQWPDRSTIAVLHTNCGIWLCYGLFYGLATSFIILRKIYIRVLGPRFNEILDVFDTSSRLWGYRYVHIVGYVIIVIGLVPLPLVLDTYTFFKHDELVESDVLLLGPCRHPYSTIREIRFVKSSTAPNGNTLERPFYQIEFTNGFVWDSRSQLYGGPRIDRALAPVIAQVSTASAVPITVRDKP